MNIKVMAVPKSHRTNCVNYYLRVDRDLFEVMRQDDFFNEKYNHSNQLCAAQLIVASKKQNYLSRCIKFIQQCKKYKPKNTKANSFNKKILAQQMHK